MKHIPVYLASAVLAWSIMAAPAQADLAVLVPGGDTAETIQLAALPAGPAGALDVFSNTVTLPVLDSSVVSQGTETGSPRASAQASGTPLSNADVPVRIGSLGSALSNPFSHALLTGLAKPTQGFFLDNPDDPSAGISLSLTTSAPFNIITMDTPTPLPPAFLLFGSGLIGLAATRLRCRPA